MNTASKPVDVAEVAAEVVRVMFEEGIENPFLATSAVITRRKDLQYGQGVEIAKKAKILAEKHLARNPVLADHLKWQYRDRDPNFAFFSHAAASHEALAKQEA